MLPFLTSVGELVCERGEYEAWIGDGTRTRSGDFPEGVAERCFCTVCASAGGDIDAGSGVVSAMPISTS